MALLDFDGYESGVNLRPQTSLPSGGTPGVTAGSGRDGVGVSITGPASSFNVQQVFTSGSDTIFWHQGVFIHSAGFGSTSVGFCIFQLLADSGTVTHLSVNLSATGAITVRRGAANGTIIATSTNLFSSTSAWHSIEVKATIADSGGECIIKVDGVEWINFSGDTRNAGTSTRPDTLLFGGGSSSFRQDDYLIVDTTGVANNTWTGEISIVGVRPANNGANSGLTGSDGNSVNNYQQVDEYPFNTTDYNGSVTTGLLDTYDMTAVGKTGTVLGVQLLSYAAKSDTGTKSFKQVTRSSGGTLMKTSAIPLSTTYSVYSSPIYLTDADGTAWTVSLVDSAEFGFEVV